MIYNSEKLKALLRNNKVSLYRKVQKYDLIQSVNDLFLVDICYLFLETEGPIAAGRVQQVGNEYLVK